MPTIRRSILAVAVAAAVAVTALVGAAPVASASTMLARGCATSAPSIAPSDIVVTSQVLVRGNVHYVAGGSLDITLRSCSSVNAVFLGGQAVPRLPDGPVVDPPDTNWSVTSRFTSAPLRLEYTLRLRFPNRGQGGTAPVRVIVGNPANPASVPAVLDFTLSKVKAVGTPKGALVSTSQAELSNEFNLAVRSMFLDAGRFGKLYDPQYRRDVITVTPAGLRFQWKFRSDEALCDPRLSVDGLFRIEKDGLTRAKVVWYGGTTVVTGPRVGISFPDDVVGECSAASFVFELIKQSRTLAKATVRDSVAQLLQEKVGAIDATFIQAFETLPGELRFRTFTIGDSVTVNVPYRPVLGQGRDTADLAVNAGDHLAVVSSGMATACTSDASVPSPTCMYGLTRSAHATGPNGLLNSPPLPGLDPTLPDFTRFPERVELYNALHMLTRRVALPVPGSRVGALVGRVTNRLGGSSKLVGANGRIDVLSPATVQFGVNERPDTDTDVVTYAWGSGSYRTTIMWLP